MPAAEKDGIGSVVFESYLRPNLLSGAVERVQALKAQGSKVVIVSGSLDFIVEPVARYLGVDAVLAARMEQSPQGVLTGRLLGKPVSDAEKARLMQAYAAEHGFSLQECEVGCCRFACAWRACLIRAARLLPKKIFATVQAYGDSMADLPMLEAVGRPFCVSPDSRLRKVAQERAWPILPWRG